MSSRHISMTRQARETDNIVIKLDVLRETLLDRLESETLKVSILFPLCIKINQQHLKIVWTSGVILGAKHFMSSVIP